MRDFVRKPKNWFLVMIVVAVLASLIFSFTSSFNTNLPSYNGENLNVEPTTTPEITELSIPTTVFTVDEYNLSMPVPSEWTHVVKSGHNTFVNPVDASQIAFQIGEYIPEWNTITEEVFTSQVANQGGLVGAFTKISNSSFVAVYEIGTLDYFEYYSWDFNTAVCISVQIPAQRYTTYKDDILALFDQFQWIKANPIPEGYHMYFGNYGGVEYFEFLVPDTWTYGIENGEFVAISEETGANFRVNVTSTTASLSTLSQIDYVSAMSQGKSGYLLSVYNNTGSVLNAEASFQNNGVGYIELHNMLATGSYHYEFLFQCPQSASETEVQHYLTIVKNFRIF